MRAYVKCQKSLGTWALVLILAIGLLCQSCYAQEEQARPGVSEEYEEIVNLNERLRDELNDLNSDLDRMRTVQRWTFALVGIGALSLGFVLGYLGRHLKATAKAS